MRVFVAVICILSLALAEPPVGVGYPSAPSSHDLSHDHGNDFQRSVSQEYGPPAARSLRTPRNEISREYLPPNIRAASPQSRLSQNYGPPNTRDGISQKFGVPSSRSSAKNSPASKSLSTEYGVPNTRSGSSETYSALAAQSGLLQEYGVPSVISDIVRTTSTQYEAPELRTLSEEYGVPSQRSSGNTPSQKYGPPTARNSQVSEKALSEKYGVPSTRSSNFQQGHSSPRSFAKSFVSSRKHSPKVPSQFGARSRSTSNEVPAAKNFGSHSQKTKASSQTYRPKQRDLLDTYEVPSARGLSQKYGVPASRAANQMTSAITSSYTAAARSAPSDTYGAPSARDSKPSEQYGVPDQYSNLSNNGYSDARDALDENLNQEPASYDFAYKVNDYESGSDFGHTETRQDNRAEGSYFVVLPDGTKQVVEYEADERGFKPRISVEPADLGRSGGYDDNAAELASSNDGPY